MSTNFPGSLDDGTSLPYPAPLSSRNNPSLAGVISDQNDAIIAVETKLGIGASTATSGKLLTGTGAGTSAWAGTAPASGIYVGTTDAQTLSNKTLTAPIINNPSISNATITADSVAGHTLANDGTIYGVNVTASKIDGSSLTNNSITNTQMAVSSINYNNLTTDSTWAWQAYVPTLSGATGTFTYARYIKVGKTVFFSIKLTVTAVSGDIIIGRPPVAPVTSTANDDVVNASCMFRDTSLNRNWGAAAFWGGGSGTTSWRVRPQEVNTSDYVRLDVSATNLIPFTWASGDTITMSGMYEGT